MKLNSLEDEPMISPSRIAQRRRCDKDTVKSRIRKLKAAGRINPDERLGRFLLSFNEARIVDKEFER